MRNGERLPAFSSLDIFGETTFNVGPALRLTPYLGIQNLTDRNNLTGFYPRSGVTLLQNAGAQRNGDYLYPSQARRANLGVRIVF